MNCLTFALKKFWKEGGYIAFRRTRVEKFEKRKPGKWFHVLWIKDLKDAVIEHYVPIKFNRNKLLPPVNFKGYVKKDDKDV
jgi:hypothetical protein